MIAISVKPVCSVLLDEIKEKIEGYTPFYREYILSPVAEKDGELQVKHAAARYANIEFLSRFCKHKFAKVPRFSFEEGKKPCFEGEYSALSFSFSHSGALAVCAVSCDTLDADGPFECGCENAIAIDEAAERSDMPIEIGEFGACLTLCADACEVGVDVQVARECDIPLTYNHEKIGERFFSGEDYARLLKNPTEDSFYRLWTKTESLAKMTGEGIARYKRRGKESAVTHTVALSVNGERYYLSVSLVQ